MRYTLHLGDCRDVMASMEADSIDAIVSDPPYGLSFMGKGWDHGVPGVEFWREALRVLKPGGHVLAFGGTRTFHRLAVGIEDAGFEIRDCLSWMYGSGFPKSHNIGNGWGTALKPSWEPVIMARKPLQGTVASNVAEWGTGAVNIDGCRVGESGRWPANTILDEEAAALLDAQSGVSVSAGGISKNKGTDSVARGKFKYTEFKNHDDSGGASRFFYVAKASAREREAGLEGMEVRKAGAMSGEETREDRPTNHPMRANHHPTVKPIALMRYLVRMVTPPDGVVLDPFMGSGSTGCAAMVEGMRFVGIDITPEYVEIARKRIARWSAESVLQ